LSYILDYVYITLACLATLTCTSVEQEETSKNIQAILQQQQQQQQQQQPVE
jgi:heme exporter protein D